MTIDSSAFDAAVRRHHAAVFRTARRIVRSDADAADVAQQVFLAAWRGTASVAGDDGEVQRRLRWLCSRLALNSLRAERRRRHRELETATMDPTADARALSADESASVRASIDALDDDLRATVVLRFHEGLTLAAIGEAMGCAESTVHGRLRAAFDALRHRLRDLGFAGAVARLEDAVTAAGDAALPVPADLPARLLAIPATAGGLAAVKVAAAAIVLLGAGGIAFAAASQAPALPRSDGVVAASAGAGTAGPTASPHDGVAAPGQDPARTQAPPVQQEPDAGSSRDARAAAIAAAPTAHVTGTITHERGEPLADVAVVAYCRALSSKGESFEVRATTDVQGSYELALPITERDGLDYHLTLRRADWIGAFPAPELHLLAGDLRAGVDAGMRRWAADTPGEWATAALITDAAGRPVEGAVVLVFRRTPGADGEGKLLQEASAKTDAGGHAALQGDHHGEKLVRVVAWGQPFAQTETPLAIRAATPPEFAIVLAADTALRVRAVDARSGAPVGKLLVTAERDDRSLAVSVTADDGTATLRGTDALPCNLTGGNRPWSRFTLTDVVAGNAVVELRLKRADDPQPVGLHGCEFHGRVVDAVTGAPVAVEYGNVGTWWLAPDSPTTAQALLAEAITPWPYQTAMMGEPPPPSAEFHLEVQTPGRYAVLLRTEGRAVAVVGPFDLAPGQVIAGIELRAEAGADVEVTVRDASGSAVAGAEVWLGLAGAEADQGRRMRAVELARESRAHDRGRAGRGSVTDPQGRVAFRHVPSGVVLTVHAVDGQGRDGCSGSAAFPASGTAQREVVLR